MNAYPDLLTRGELAKRSGVNRETVRYYERSGLLPEPARSDSNYCLFAPPAVDRVRFIKRAQAVGFSLDQIKTLLQLRISDDSTCGDVRELVTEKIADIDEKLRALNAMRDTLAELLDDCPGGNRPVDECPILGSFASEVVASV